MIIWTSYTGHSNIWGKSGSVVHDLETNRVLAAYRQQARYGNNYMSKCLKFISKLSVNLIHSIIEPNTKIIDTGHVLLKFKRNSHRLNTRAETTDQNPNTWRQDEPRHPPPTQRSAATAPPGPSSAQDTNPARGVVEEPTEQNVPRKIMEKFQGLRPCLRKPCPWMDQCRNLHLPYGKSEQNIRFKKRCKFYPFRRIRPLFDSPDHQPSDWIKAGKNVPTPKGEPQETVHRQEDENRDTPVERELPKKVQETRTRSSSEELRAAPR